MRFVVALAAEARPLIRRFGLERAASDAFPIWQAGETALVVSGVGRDAAAAAVGYLAGRAGALEPAWLNVGIGGHRSLALGEAVLAHKVMEQGSGMAWYPPLVFEPPCATASVTTVDRPETGYPEETVYEMEAAGFCSAACHFASAELVQVVKVISDNRQAPPAGLSAARVEALVDEQIETVEAIARQTAGLAAELEARRSPPPELDGYRRRWRFSVTQGRQLERLLRRLAALEEIAPEAGELDGHRSARAVLATLEQRLAAHPPGIG